VAFVFRAVPLAPLARVDGSAAKERQIDHFLRSFYSRIKKEKDLSSVEHVGHVRQLAGNWPDDRMMDPLWMCERPGKQRGRCNRTIGNTVMPIGGGACGLVVHRSLDPLGAG
jgi:hypothetical protein